MKPHFLKGITSFFLLFFCFSALSQNSAKQKQDQSATVNVMVTDFTQKPLKGAEVLFVSTTNKSLVGRTDASGKFTLMLPGGSIYSIKLKTMTDTSNYSTIEVPALAPGEYFDAPITVNIQYEPPRNFTLDNVHFDTGKPSLRPESFKELNEIADYMKLKEEETYEIAGHTDNVGKDADNLKLSQQRAESVKNYLVKKGIKSTRIIAKGYGATRPLTDNSTTEGKQKNRRTELIIL